MVRMRLFAGIVGLAAAVAGCGGGDEGGPDGRINNGIVVAVGKDLLIAVSRDSGATWEKKMEMPGLPEEQGLLVRASYINGRFFAFGWRLFTSTDTVTWQELQAPVREWYGEVAFGDGLYLTAGGYGATLRSADGLTWEAGGVIPNVSKAGVRSVAFGNGRFAAAADNGVFVTADQGATWTIEPGLQTINVAFCDGAFKDGDACKRNNPSAGAWAGHGYQFRTRFPEGILVRSGAAGKWDPVGLPAPRDLAFAPPPM